MLRNNGRSQTMRETGQRLASGARHSWRQSRAAMRDIDDRFQASVRRHPLGMLLAGIGIGIVAGFAMTVACPASFPRLKNGE